MQKTKKRSFKPGKPKKKLAIQLAEYLISGGAYFWTGYLAFFLFDKGLHWGLFAAKITADVVGWVVNFWLQRFWVFDSPKLAKHKAEMTGRYIIITAVDFLIDYLIVRGLKSIGITPYIGQFFSAAFFTVWNYFWYKLWVFPDRRNKKASA